MARGRHCGPLPRILTGLPLCFVLLFAASGQAPLQHEVTVTLKLIQVFVTGPDGKPALDLDRSDFVLTDNGKPQTITDFESHVLAVPAAERAVAVAAPAPVPVPAGEAPLLNRKFIFLIDYVTNDFEGVQKAKAAALEFLETKVGPDDEVGLFTLSPMSGLTLHDYLTKDHAKVRAKIKKLRESRRGSATPWPQRPSSWAWSCSTPQVIAGHGDHAGPSQRNIFEDIAAWAKSLRAIPGRKNIILFTRGFGNGVVRPGRLNNVLFETMARELATANAPVFTVDTSAPGRRPGRDIEIKLPSGTLTELSLDYLSKTTGGMYHRPRQLQRQDRHRHPGRHGQLLRPRLRRPGRLGRQVPRGQGRGPQAGVHGPRPAGLLQSRPVRQAFAHRKASPPGRDRAGRGGRGQGDHDLPFDRRSIRGRRRDEYAPALGDPGRRRRVRRRPGRAHQPGPGPDERHRRREAGGARPERLRAAGSTSTRRSRWLRDDTSAARSSGTSTTGGRPSAPARSMWPLRRRRAGRLPAAPPRPRPRPAATSTWLHRGRRADRDGPVSRRDLPLPGQGIRSPRRRARTGPDRALRDAGAACGGREAGPGRTRAGRPDRGRGERGLGAGRDDPDLERQPGRGRLLSSRIRAPGRSRPGATSSRSPPRTLRPARSSERRAGSQFGDTE